MLLIDEETTYRRKQAAAAGGAAGYSFLGFYEFTYLEMRPSSEGYFATIDEALADIRSISRL
jgi:hypothetical protein